MSALSEWAQGIDLSRILDWLMFAAAAMLAISVHESSHGLSAYWLGDDTARRMGRISLNPLRHLDLTGFILMVLVHFGWAKPVPVNPYRMTKLRNPKAGMAITAAAGPLSNVLLALIFSLLTAVFSYLYADDLMGRMLQEGERIADNAVLRYLQQFFCVNMVLNAGLAVFNLIPISPLDGSKILAIVLPKRTYELLMRYERYGFLVLALLLFAGVLDGPIISLREGLLKALASVTVPLAKLLTNPSDQITSVLIRSLMGL